MPTPCRCKRCPVRRRRRWSPTSLHVSVPVVLRFLGSSRPSSASWSWSRLRVAERLAAFRPGSRPTACPRRRLRGMPMCGSPAPFPFRSSGRSRMSTPVWSPSSAARPQTTANAGRRLRLRRRCLRPAAQDPAGRPGHVGGSPAEADQVCRAAGIDPTLRGERSRHPSVRGPRRSTGQVNPAGPSRRRLGVDVRRPVLTRWRHDLGPSRARAGDGACPRQGQPRALVGGLRRAASTPCRRSSRP